MESLKLTTIKHLVGLLSFEQRADLMRAGLNTEVGRERTRLLERIVDGDYDIITLCGYCGTPETQSSSQISDGHVYLGFCDICNKYVCDGYNGCGIHMEGSYSEVLCLNCNDFKCFVCNSTSPREDEYGFETILSCDECEKLVCRPCAQERSNTCKRCAN